MNNEAAVTGAEPGLGVYLAINRVQAELASEGIAKTRNNDAQRYKFRGIDDVYNALSPVLARHALCVIPRYTSRTCEERITKSGGAMFYVTVEGEYDIICATDGSRISARLYGEAMDSGDKATNKAMSAAYKYLCMQLFCIPTEGGDNDADATTHEVAPRGAQPQQQRPSNNHLTAVDGGGAVDGKAEADVIMSKMPKATRETWLKYCVDQFGRPYASLTAADFDFLLKELKRAA